MFQFKDKFNELSNEVVHLKVIEKHPGNEVLLPFYYYDIYENHSNKKVGKISIRIGHNYHSYFNGHIGYEVDECYRGNAYSYHAAKLVLQVAESHGMDFLYITCQVSNQASRRIVEKIGGELLEVVEVPEDYFGWYERMEPYCIFKIVSFLEGDIDD